MWHTWQYLISYACSAHVMSSPSLQYLSCELAALQQSHQLLIIKQPISHSYINTAVVLAALGFVLQYLCCELAALQQSHQLCQLQVFDVAHMAWRLQVACQLGDAKQAYEQVRWGQCGHTWL